MVFGLNLVMWGAAFYRWIVIENKFWFGMFPAAIAVPGIAVLCFIRLYATEHATSNGDKIAGHLISYTFLIIAISGVLGL